MAAKPSLRSLAAQLYKEACFVEDFLDEHGLPQPSFEPGDQPFTPPAPIEREAAASYERLLDAARQLYLLALGPVGLLHGIGCEDLLALQFIYRFNIDQHVPSGTGSAISFDELASVAQVPNVELRRFVRQSITNHIFSEPEQGFVAHSASSLALRESNVVRDIIGINVEERFLAAARTVDAIQQYPDSQEPALTGWGLANNASRPLFEELFKQYPERAKRFAGAMNFMASSIPPVTFTDNYPWEALGDATVVDVGGAEGPVSVALAKKFPKLKFVVQDLEGPVAAGRDTLPDALRSRVTFQVHDFFREQPVYGADVYFLR